jgi:hypothetical protein
MLVAAAPAEAVIRASGELRRISTTRYELVVRNTGDEPFRSISFLTLQVITLSAVQTSGGDCASGSNFYGESGFICRNSPVDPGRSRIFSFSTNRSYATGTGGRLFAFQGPDPKRPGETSEPIAVTGPTVAGQPVIGRSEVVEPVRGVVLVRRRESDRFVRLRRGQLLPDGSEIDTRRGTARVTVASDQPGGLSSATLSEGRAIIDQNRARRPTTTLKLSEPLACPRLATVATAATARARKGRQIFVKTSGGRFKTRGNHAAGTATGTAWRTIDTCNSTTINVTERTVRVRDLRRRRTLNVTAPNSYTARRR